jgi:hypothetical protein
MVGMEACHESGTQACLRVENLACLVAHSKSPEIVVDSRDSPAWLFFLVLNFIPSLPTRRVADLGGISSASHDIHPHANAKFGASETLTIKGIGGPGWADWGLLGGQDLPAWPAPTFVLRYGGSAPPSKLLLMVGATLVTT